jgi:Cdc6-like AAA superfamily ATPase
VYCRIGNTIIQPKAVEFLAARVASKSGDARWMLELVSHTIRIRYEELSDESRKEAVSKNPVVGIREAIMAIKSTVVAYVDRIDALPEMAKMVLCVAITLCSHTRSSYSLGMLRSACSDVAMHEQLEPLDFDTFKQLVQQLVDQGLLLPNDDTDSDIGSGGTFAIHDMPVRFGVQLHDIEAAVSDTLETKPVYRKLIESIKRNPNLNC